MQANSNCICLKKERIKNNFKQNPDIKRINKIIAVKITQQGLLKVEDQLQLLNCTQKGSYFQNFRKNMQKISKCHANGGNVVRESNSQWT